MLRLPNAVHSHLVPAIFSPMQHSAVCMQTIACKMPGTSSHADAIDICRKVPGTKLLRRRSFLRALACLAAVPALADGADCLAQTAESKRRPALLQSPHGIDQLATRSRFVLQLSGTLKVADPDPSSKKPPREAEVKAESTVDYDERIAIDTDNQVLAAARSYNEASVKSWVAGHASSHTLREERFDARLVREAGVWQQYSPSGPMQPRELDLVRLPINTVVVDWLLPTTPVKPESTWSPDEKIVAELFQLEAVHSTNLSARVAKVENGVATIECAGEIQGTANSVPTRLVVEGNLHASLGTKSAFVTWVGMSITETRDISQAEPGFKLTARIEMIRKEEPQACADVSYKELRMIADSNDESRMLSQIASVPGRYQMLADRRWKTIVDTGEEAILRLVDKNQVVAQCNITRLPKMNPGQQLTLAGMQDDIKRSLEKNLDSLVEASERKNSSQLRVLRVVAVGKSADVPVRWVYAHISDDTGRRVSLVFTMSGEASESFGMADEQMISSFELLPEGASQSPTPAAPALPVTTPTAKASNSPSSAQSATKPVSIQNR